VRLAIPAAALFLAAAAGYVVAAGLERRGLKILTKPFAVPLLALAYVLGACRADDCIAWGKTGEEGMCPGEAASCLREPPPAVCRRL